MDRESRIKKAAQLTKEFRDKRARLEKARRLSLAFKVKREDAAFPAPNPERPEPPTHGDDLSSAHGQEEAKGEAPGPDQAAGGPPLAEAGKEDMPPEQPEHPPLLRRKWPKVAGNFTLSEDIVNGLAALEKEAKDHPKEAPPVSKLSKRRRRANIGDFFFAVRNTPAGLTMSSPSDTPSESGKTPGRPGSPPRATPGRPDSLPPRLAEDTPRRRLPGPAGNYAERKRMKMQIPLNSEVDDIKDPFASSIAWSKMLAEQGQDESDPAADINHYNLAWANKGKKFGQVRKAPALYALIKSVKLTPDPKCVLQDRSGSAQAMIHPNLLRTYKEQGRFVEGAALAIGGPAVITICGGGGIVITKDNLLALYPPGPCIPNNESPCPEAPQSHLADVDPKSIFGEF